VSTTSATCGVGVGETVRHALEHPWQVLRYGDFFQSSAANERAQIDKLQARHRATLSILTAPLIQ
jgi:adenylosuccinate synthase